MTKQVIRWAAALAATGVLVVGCGSDEKSSSGTSGGAGTGAAAVEGASKASAESKAWCDDLLATADQVAAATVGAGNAEQLQKLTAEAAKLTAEGASIVQKHSGDAAYVGNCETAAGDLVQKAHTGAGSSDTAASTDTAAGYDTAASDDTVTEESTGSGGAATADAEEWCKKAQELADAIKALKADPSKPVDIAQKMADATKILQQAPAIAAKSPANQKIISACSDKISKELNG